MLIYSGKILSYSASVIRQHAMPIRPCSEIIFPAQFVEIENFVERIMPVEIERQMIRSLLKSFVYWKILQVIN